MFNEGNQIHNFMSSSGSGTVINYGSGSDFLTSYGSGQVPLVKKLLFLRFRFRFHNTDYEGINTVFTLAQGHSIIKSSCKILTRPYI